MSPRDGGTRLEWGAKGRGMRALSQILSDESLSYSLKHISTGEHSLHISRRSTHLLHLYFPFSWWRHQMQTCSASLAFVRGIHRWLRGIHRSPVNSPHTDQWRRALMFSLICAWTNGWVNNQDAGDFRRHRSHYDVIAMWYQILIQWYGQPWYLSAFNASLLSNFELVKRVKLGGSVHYGRNGLKFGTLLCPDYHSSKLTICCIQWQFKFVVSDHPWINLELWRKQMENTFFIRMSDLHAMPITISPTMLVIQSRCAQGPEILHVSYLTTIIKPVSIFVCRGSAVYVSKITRPK